MFISLMAAFLGAVSPSDCLVGRADSTCVQKLAGGTVGIAGGGENDQALYDGVLDGVPPTGKWYWGYDFESDYGIDSEYGLSMYINRSSEIIEVTLSFDVPPSGCGDGCLPGLEFKLGHWNSVFPVIAVANGRAEASVLISPGQAYGWVIGLWAASNPHLRVVAHGKEHVDLATVGLPNDMGHQIRTVGTYYACSCRLDPCYTGTKYSTGFVGAWGSDGYSSDAIYCNDTGGGG
jgi:hypothetical protein